MKQFIKTLADFFATIPHKTVVNYENKRILLQHERESIIKEIEALTLVVEVNSNFVTGDWDLKDSANKQIKSLMKLL